MSSITWSPIMAFAMLALAFTIGDYVSSKTKGIIASILTVDILFLIFGGILHILPPDLVQINFMVQITGAIGLALVLTNLGSIKLHAGYHHLTNWGTTSVFCAIGEIKKRPFYNDDGTFEMKPSIDLGLTIDERIADGYYYAKTVRLLKTLLENPQLLDKPLQEEVDY